MNNFAIVPDSSSDMTAQLRLRFGVDAIVRGVIYRPDGTESLSDVDWENTTPDEYFNSMKGRKALYKTATPSMSEYFAAFEPLLQAGKDILSISLSSGISGTYQVAQSAAKELSQKYPDRKIICVDSLRYSSAIALLVAEASFKREQGATIEETAEYINTLKHSIHQIGPLDDLFFCVKTGRISNFQAFFGTLIGVNSLADFAGNGVSAVLGKTKGRKTALEVALRYIEKTIKNPEKQIIFVGHSIREENALYLKDRIIENFAPKDVIINPIGMSCGSSIGPGLCAAFYIGDTISSDGSTEKLIFEEALHEATMK